MLFDTDVLIWFQKGSSKAASLFEATEERNISVQTYMELLQGASSKSQHKTIRDFLKVFSFRILPLTENIGHRASIYVEDYALSDGIRAGDAIIAATAVEHGLVLSTANGKHFKAIAGLATHLFRP